MSCGEPLGIRDGKRQAQRGADIVAGLAAGRLVVAPADPSDDAARGLAGSSPQTSPPRIFPQIPQLLTSFAVLISQPSLSIMLQSR